MHIRMGKMLFQASCFCLLCICLGLTSCRSSRTINREWSLQWEENFNQKNSFDSLVWSKIPRGKSDWNKYMTDFDSCYALRKGNLILRGIANQSQPNDTAPYLTGGIYTKGKKTFTNGRIEICAKLNGAQGAWPAIWMLPEHAAWPTGGEIDIMERLSFDSIAYQTVHSNYTYNLGIKDNPLSHSTGSIHPDEYNVYAVEISADSLSFFINNKHTFTYPRIRTDKEGQFPFSQPFYLLIDMQLGGSWVGKVNPKDLPVEMEVDWVRFYQKKKDMNIQFPPYLREGDKAIIVSPSSKIDKSFLTGAKERLESWGLKVMIAKHADSASATYAGTLKNRLEDLQNAMDDKDAKIILCSRGGYGAIHLVDKLDFATFKQHPKWLIGFSDITALHNLFQANGFASVHAPMARHLTVEPEDDACTLHLKKMLFGELPVYSAKKHTYNQPGTATGTLRGGNLAVAYGLRGTPYDIPAPGTILFIEDVNERPHAVERMIYNLKLGGVLENLSGLIIGQFTEYEETCSLGKDLYGALHDLVKEYPYPVCFNFPVGHVTENLPLIEGAQVELVVNSDKTVELKFHENY